MEFIKPERVETDVVYYNLNDIVNNVHKKIQEAVSDNQYGNMYAAANTLLTTNSNKFNKI